MSYATVCRRREFTLPASTGVIHRSTAWSVGQDHQETDACDQQCRHSGQKQRPDLKPACEKVAGKTGKNR
jgi:hypothetical protein